MDTGKLPCGCAELEVFSYPHKLGGVPGGLWWDEQLGFAKENSYGELKTLDRPRVSVLLLKELARYLYSEHIFLPYFH